MVIALDTSDSVVGERLTQLRTAGLALVDALKPSDQAALLTEHRQRPLATGEPHDFTLSLAKISYSAMRPFDIS